MLTSLHINELLYTNDCVIIPGLGGFVANTKSAFLNPAQHTFNPPSRKLAFNASLRTNDGLLAHHLSSKTGITYGEALSEINKYVDDIFNTLAKGEPVHIEKVGSLSFDKEKRIQYEPDLSENHLTASFGLTTIHSPAIRRDEIAKVKKLSVKKEKKNRQGWKLLELIPAAAVLALLVFNPKIVNTLNTGLADVFPIKEWFAADPLKPVDKANEQSREKEDRQHNLSEVPPGAAEVSAETTAPPVAKTESTAADSTKVEEVVIEEKAIIKAEHNEASTSTFHIIGGCFKIEDNAKKLVEEAGLMGYDAEIIGQNEHGLHIVSLFSSTDMNKVQQELGEIQTSFEKGAWVFVK